jgi:hypothetical protein
MNNSEKNFPNSHISIYIYLFISFFLHTGNKGRQRRTTIIIIKYLTQTKAKTKNRIRNSFIPVIPFTSIFILFFRSICMSDITNRVSNIRQGLRHFFRNHIKVVNQRRWTMGRLWSIGDDQRRGHRSQNLSD